LDVEYVQQVPRLQGKSYLPLRGKASGVMTTEATVTNEQTGLSFPLLDTGIQALEKHGSQENGAPETGVNSCFTLLSATDLADDE
jgi:hypothetical protein